MNIKIKKEEDLTPEVFWLFSDDRLITEVFLITEEETEDDFSDGTKYIKVCDLTSIKENETGYQSEDFFLTQEGCEAWRRELES